MSYSIGDVTTDLGAMMHGQNTNQIVNLYGLYNRAARQILLDVDPQETKRITPFVTPIYNQVFDYAENLEFPRHVYCPVQFWAQNHAH